ncbi:hemerythrin family protein [Propionivibrio sp.]|uniref:bacteriohemerythrin n=1 Tax=Propionivibrio sp. TaxID=2212460 RepID=UPI0025EF707A|nr:hemerythrin family protein [Propionivibrio sp.]MBK7356457.1 hemerythrin family protein [Propionivibrio sp.]MBK8400076.1 hemerythrin family protein [Propionivibrio sp.]MBK8744682.1 hemerythrin family protein [Propionivibrio sp.]MBK8893766.1 hemerythrin family protein [Propionivibrio sp.]MBL0207894.1 hemerythrin family protein [Propionivibrio sp.]
MSSFSDFNQQSDVRTDGEHQIQLDMLSALCRAVRKSPPSAEVGEILERLVAYCEAHFMSEELLMRLNSYDSYEEHVGEHIGLMDDLERITSAHNSGNSGLLAEQADSVFKLIGQHIGTHDKRFSDFMAAGMQGK